MALENIGEIAIIKQEGKYFSACSRAGMIADIALGDG